MNKNKKISFFIPSLRGGGAERMMVNLANEFARQGYLVDLVVAQREGPYLSAVSREMKVVDLQASRILFSLWPLRRYLRRVRPEVVVASMEHAVIITLVAKYLAFSKTKVIARVANTLSVSLQGTKWHRRVIRKYGAFVFYRLVDQVVCNSQGSADDLARTLGLKRERIKVIHNPTVTPELFEKAQALPDHPWLNSDNQKVILGVGRLHPQKGFATLIRAFEMVKKAQPEAKLIILGEGQERARLESLVKELNLEGEVDLPGFAGNPYSFMAYADVYVLASRWEGLPNTLIEALAVGTPVIATDCPSGPREILNGNYELGIQNTEYRIKNPEYRIRNTELGIQNRESETENRVIEAEFGKLVPVGGHQAMAQAILATLGSPLEPGRLRERAQEFSAERSAKRYLELVERWG